MKILSVVAGNNSLKFSLFDMDNFNALATGVFERIGIDGSKYTIKYDDQVITQEIELEDYVAACRTLLDKLIGLEIIKSSCEIDGVGHRVAHGKDIFNKSTIITDEVIEKLKELKDIAPLHNPSNILGIEAFREVLPGVLQVAVFDTAFHQTMDEVTYLYPVPYSWYKDYGLRKYGFHGTSHRFIVREVKKILNKDEFKLISCHLGVGCSIAAIKDGKCVDTSMGFTPVAGIMMETRSGDVDPSIIPYIMEKEGKNASEVVDDLNKNSGLYGMSGFSDNINDIINRSAEGDHLSTLAKEKFVRRIVDYIAQYYVLLDGADIITFSGDVGINNNSIRKEVCEKLGSLGIKFDNTANESIGTMTKLSAKNSKVLVWAIPTNEELLIAKDTYNLINR